MFDPTLLAMLGVEAPLVAQYLRPNADVDIATWQAYGATPLYECVNEEVADDDSTYVYNESNGGYVRFGLTDLVPPDAYIDPTEQHKIVVRARYVGTPGTTPYLDIFLQENAAVRAFSTVNYMTTSYVDYELTLTADEIASIQNYNNLQIACAVYASIGAGYAARISQVFMLVGDGFVYPLWDDFTVSGNVDLASYTGPQGQTYTPNAGRFTVLDAIDAIRHDGATGFNYGYGATVGEVAQEGDEFICEMKRGTALTGAARDFGFVFMCVGDQTKDHVEIDIECAAESTVKFYGQTYVEGVGYQDIQTFDLTLPMGDQDAYRFVLHLKTVNVGTSMVFDVYTEPVGGGTKTLRYSNWTVARDWVNSTHKFMGIWDNKVSTEVHEWDILGIRRAI